VLAFVSARSFSHKTGKFSRVRVLDVSHELSEPGNARRLTRPHAAILAPSKAWEPNTVKFKGGQA
jgi:hypothetical protein